MKYFCLAKWLISYFFCPILSIINLLVAVVSDILIQTVYVCIKLNICTKFCTNFVATIKQKSVFGLKNKYPIGKNCKETLTKISTQKLRHLEKNYSGQMAQLIFVFQKYLFCFSRQTATIFSISLIQDFVKPHKISALLDNFYSFQGMFKFTYTEYSKH